VRVQLKVKPRSSKVSVELVSLEPTLLQVAVREAAVDGAATRAALSALAYQLGIAPAEVQLIAGQKSRFKLVQIPDSCAALLQHWAGTVAGQ
jgi:uncharacterized protein YggU (UPF0235/DUF167 family)